MTAEDEYYCDAPAMRRFIEAVQGARSRGGSPEALVSELRPAFTELLADPDWLPDRFRAANPEGGMGGGIASWLLYRSAGRDLTLMSLVVPSGSQTPVHDHLAWGLVGLYAGEQDEEVYERTDDAAMEGIASLSLAAQRRLSQGSFYDLLPPEGDIHRVRTTSPEASVSIHLLGNDVGCVLRHSFEPSIDAVAAFRSGYSNVECPDEPNSFMPRIGTTDG
jgi:predicted metal-dependent enzyme (double-stranded beta helix superfamily)